MMRQANTASIFFDLSTLINAGISVLDAARKVAENYPQNSRLQLAIRTLERGSTLSVALRAADMTNRFENEIIAIAEQSGRLEQGLKALANATEKRQARASQLKSKLLYPMAILFVAILVSAVLNITRNPDVSLLWVLLKTVLQLVFTFWLIRHLVKLSRQDADFWLVKLNGFESKPWYKVQFQQLLFEMMYWHSCSGIDAKTSFSRISKLIDSPPLKKKLLKSANLCGQGVSISSAVRQAKLPITTDMLQIFSAGEHSGAIESTLKKQLEINQQDAEIRLESLLDWAPRCFYGLVVVYAIIAIV